MKREERNLQRKDVPSQGDKDKVDEHKESSAALVERTPANDAKDSPDARGAQEKNGKEGTCK
jgi:hypothetical protein